MIRDEARSIVADVDRRIKIGMASATRGLVVTDRERGTIRRMRGFCVSFRLDKNGGAVVFAPGDAIGSIVTEETATAWFVGVRDQLMRGQFVRPAWLSPEQFRRIVSLHIDRVRTLGIGTGKGHVWLYKWAFIKNLMDVHVRKASYDSDL